MQIRSKKKNQAYITIYLALSLGIIVPFIWAMIEGVSTGAARVQAKMVADLGVDSIFAEYHRELFRQYGLFFIDDSYGTESGSVKNTEDHLAHYLSKNTGEQKEGKLQNFYSFQKIKNIYLEIEEVAFATDEAGRVWKAQAIQYMLDHYGIGYLDDVKNQLQTVQDQGLCTRNLEAEMDGQLQNIKHAIHEKELEEEEDVDKDHEEQGFSVEKIEQAFDEWRGQGVLGTVLADGGNLSNMAFHKHDYAGERYKRQACNTGRGVPDYVRNVDSLDQELIYNEFLLEKYGYYRHEKDNSYLSYEMEYILGGHENDQSNLRSVAEKLLLMREVSNFIYLNTKDPVKKAEVEAICTAICTFCLVPECSGALTQVVLGAWAYKESLMDVRILLQGGRVSLYKERGDWNTGLTSILIPGIWGNGTGSGSATALDYKGYLRILLGLMNPEEKLLRSLDVVELDIRKTAGNEAFRLDQCIDSALISMGFEDCNQHEFVFSTDWRYE